MYEAQDKNAHAALLEKYLPLVKRIAHHMAGRLPANISVDDLIQNGMMGLLDALRRGEEDTEPQFESYVVQRIRGAILDGLRAMDWVPRKVRQDMRRIETALRTLEQKIGRQPTDSDVATELGVSLEDYHQLLLDARGHQILYMEDFNTDDPAVFVDQNCGSSGVDPAEMLAEQSVREHLVKGIHALPERERQIMSLYYEEELTLREIGQVLGVTASRACQLHNQALARLRGRLFAEERKPARKAAKTATSRS